MGKKNRKRLSKREVLDFLACLVVLVVVDLVDQPHLFVEAAVGLAIGRAVLTERNITFNFFILSL